MHRSMLRTLAIFGLAAALSACDGPAGITAPERTGGELSAPQHLFTEGTTQKVIGPEGGTLAIGDNTLVVPALAVKDNTVFRMTTFSGGDYCIGVELSAKSQGNPVTSFGRQLLLTLSYEGACVPPEDEESLRIQVSDGDETQVLEGGSDPLTKRVWGLVDHFSFFVVVDL